MKSDVRIEDRISGSYAELSAKLKEAADYVVANQLEIATRSLRSVSAASHLSPATFSRLARSLGFSSYEELRELCRTALGDQGLSLSDRAQRLMEDPSASVNMLERHASACVRNISDVVSKVDPLRLKAAVDALSGARNVVLFGAFSSTGVVEYMAYLAQYFSTNWTLAGRMGSSLGSSVADLTDEDVLLIVTKTPYARRAVIAAELAREAGAQVIVITDSHVCPTNRYGNFSFIVQSDSPQFFSSYVATVALIETMIAMLVAQSGDEANIRIRDVEARNKRLGDFWAD
ncbi:MurR/RpiR family transcriptional regulator [Kiloniella sp. b19]|uniref:MurR/RpiR family transcriptional regulator n=1 Tax=Kiloniella sp. GXU_MW_B19 TaxID=3141326 RepID=UPI0031E1FF50